YTTLFRSGPPRTPSAGNPTKLGVGCTVGRAAQVTSGSSWQRLAANRLLRARRPWRGAPGLTPEAPSRMRLRPVVVPKRWRLGGQLRPRARRLWRCEVRAAGGAEGPGELLPAEPEHQAEQAGGGAGARVRLSAADPQSRWRSYACQETNPVTAQAREVSSNGPSPTPSRRRYASCSAARVSSSSDLQNAP